MYTPKSGLMTPADKTKLTGIEALADVTDATNVNSAGAVMESDIKDQSFINMIKNGDFEEWSAGSVSDPDDWTSPFTNNTIYRNADSVYNNYSAACVNDGTGGDDRFIRQTVYGFKSSTVYTIGIWMKSVSGYTSIDFLMADVVKANFTITGSWAFYTASFTSTVDGGATIDFGTPGGGAINLLIDGIILVEGSVCPAFSPKPALFENGVPSGLISMWHGLIANIPNGWVLCDGTSSTPDLRSKFVRGAPAATEAGGTGGADTHTLTESEMPAHTHNQAVYAGSGPSAYLGSDNTYYTNSLATSSTGGGSAHNNMPAYYQILFIMKT